jgi:hypothetical protein
MKISDMDYSISRIKYSIARDYIREHHYSHGCHNGASPCYGLFDGNDMIGVLMFATPCSENVRSSVFGAEYKSWVTELHRLHILDVTPRNTESWFISRVLKQLKIDKPEIRAVISFSDTTVGHEGTIYKATNAYRIGSTGKSTFFIDELGRLRHPRQCGVNISKEDGARRGWVPTIRGVKNRYLYLLAYNKTELKMLKRMCRYDLD